MTWLITKKHKQQLLGIFKHRQGKSYAVVEEQRTLTQLFYKYLNFVDFLHVHSQRALTDDSLQYINSLSSLIQILYT